MRRYDIVYRTFVQLCVTSSLLRLLANVTSQTIVASNPRVKIAHSRSRLDLSVSFVSELPFCHLFCLFATADGAHLWRGQ